MIDPIKHPRRYARQRDKLLADRVRALAPSVGIYAISERIGLSLSATEELCARHAIHFTSRGRDQ